jgi:hypothetical protein
VLEKLAKTLCHYQLKSGLQAMFSGDYSKNISENVGTNYTDEAK